MDMVLSRRNRIVINFSVLGFVIGVLWWYGTWMMFTARDSAATEAVSILAGITCPFLATPLWDTGWGEVLIPFLNGGLYGVLAWVVQAIVISR